MQQALWIDVPFISQSKEGCGSASLWMIMKYWQPDAELDVNEIQHQLYSKAAGGIYAKDMSRYLKSHGFRVFAIRGEWADLQEQVSKGRPLIVSLERNTRGVPFHYVVVAGIDQTAGLVLLNDPAQRKLLSMPRAEFEQSWRSTDNWTLLAVPEVDLASTAFREQNLSEARQHLASALKVNPSDAYTNEFLATVHFLEDNTEAAVKYWNRAGKPAIENIRIDPPLRTDPVILDRAFAFSRGDVLRLNDFEKTQARLNALGVFSRYRMELTPVGDDSFDLTFRAAERSGPNAWSWLRGLPFQTVHPEFSNIGGKALNVETAVRWDSNKRRAFASIEMPLKGDPEWNVRATLDGRDENWTNDEAGFRMKKIEAAAELRAVPGGRWRWSMGTALSTRRFSNSHPAGVQLKQFASVTRTLLRDPARHFNLDSTIAVETAKLWATQPARFGKVVNHTLLRWGPVTSAVRLGTAIGQIPFDERFMIGLERDTDLWLRAHAATVEGRKNAANTSRAFVLTNFDYQKPILKTAWFQVSSGPFLDSAKSSISSRWLVDTGVEVRFGLLGSFGISVSYGKSLTDSRRSLFVRQHGL